MLTWLASKFSTWSPSVLGAEIDGWKIFDERFRERIVDVFSFESATITRGFYAYVREFAGPRLTYIHRFSYHITCAISVLSRRVKHLLVRDGSKFRTSPHNYFPWSWHVAIVMKYIYVYYRRRKIYIHVAYILRRLIAILCIVPSKFKSLYTTMYEI